VPKSKADTKSKTHASDAAPALPPTVEQYFVPISGGADNIVYHPRLVAAGDIVYSSARYKVEEERDVLYAVEFADGPVDVDWDEAEALPLSVDGLLQDGESNAAYAECPSAATNPKTYAAQTKDFKRWLRQNETISIYKSKRFKLSSNSGETEGEFRARLQDAASEKRDLAIAKIRKRYATKVTTLENRLLRAQQSIEREKEQSTKKKLDTAISFGTAILGAVLGRKKLSSATASKIGTAIKTAGGARKEASDVARATATAKKVKADIDTLNKKLEEEIAELDTSFNAQDEALDEIVVRAKSTDVHVPLIGLVWMPYSADDKGRLRATWD
jgi:hypothetical protein